MYHVNVLPDPPITDRDSVVWITRVKQGERHAESWNGSEWVDVTETAELPSAFVVPYPLIGLDLGRG